MRARSVETVVFRGDNNGQHFPLATAQRRAAKHNRTIKIHRGFHGAGVLAHDTHDIPNGIRFSKAIEKYITNSIEKENIIRITNRKINMRLKMDTIIKIMNRKLIIVNRKSQQRL